jgi:hypothetical protein
MNKRHIRCAYLCSYSQQRPAAFLASPLDNFTREWPVRALETWPLMARGAPGARRGGSSSLSMLRLAGDREACWEVTRELLPGARSGIFTSKVVGAAENDWWLGLLCLVRCAGYDSPSCRHLGLLFAGGHRAFCPAVGSWPRLQDTYPVVVRRAVLLGLPHADIAVNEQFWRHYPTAVNSVISRTGCCQAISKATLIHGVFYILYAYLNRNTITPVPCLLDKIASAPAVTYAGIDSITASASRHNDRVSSSNPLWLAIHAISAVQVVQFVLTPSQSW